MSRTRSGQEKGPGGLSARELIDILELEPLALEGGWFRQTYCSALSFPAGSPPGAPAQAGRDGHPLSSDPKGSLRPPPAPF